MFVAGNFLAAVAQILSFVLTAYMWIIIIYAVMSWINPDPYNPIVQFIHRIVDPFLNTIRKILPFAVGPLDLTPMIGILIILFTQRFVVGTLFDLSMRLR